MGFACSVFTSCPDVQTLSGPPWKKISQGGWFFGFVFFCVCVFFSFYKSLLMFWPKYNKWEVKPTDMTVVPVTSREPPLSPPPPPVSHWSTLGQSQATQASLGLLLPHRCAGQLLQLARKTGTACCGQELAELLKDVGPVERQAPLEYAEVGNFYIRLCVCICGPSCHVYMSVDHLHGPSCRNVCVSTSVCVQ